MDSMALLPAICVFKDLLTTGIFPAIYASYAPQPSTVLSNPCGQQAFRLLCKLSFVSSIVSITAATTVLYQAASSDTRSRPFP